MAEEKPLEFAPGLSIGLQLGKKPRQIICPRCGQLGSGLHEKWVLNEQKTKYFPYYWVAHSVKKLGKWAIKWCYVKKKTALAMLKEGSVFLPSEPPLAPLSETPLTSDTPSLPFASQPSENTEKNK